MYFNENMPNCFYEDIRAKEEYESLQYSQSLKRQERYKTNKEKLERAYKLGLPVMKFSESTKCFDCPYADEDTMTDDEDDSCTVICGISVCVKQNKRRR